jgi:hypothetical protein
MDGHRRCRKVVGLGLGESLVRLGRLQQEAGAVRGVLEHHRGVQHVLAGHRWFVDDP